MIDFSEGNKWQEYEATSVVFDGEGDRTVRPITEPAIIEAMERLREMYRESFGLDEDDGDGDDTTSQ